MSLCETYHQRLKLLTNGYVKEITQNMEIPTEITELIKIWHGKNITPKLQFNMLMSCDKIMFEIYLDKTDCKVLNINKYTIQYETHHKENTFLDAAYSMYNVEEEIVPKENGQENITHFYDKHNLIAFVGINNTNKDYFSSRDGTFKLSAKDTNDCVVAEADISTEYGTSLYLGIYADFGKIDVNGKGKVNLKDWMEVKNILNIVCNDLLWKRIFYFANFMAGRDNDYYMDKDDLRRVCERFYKVEEYENVVRKLRDVVIRPGSDFETSESDSLDELQVVQ